MSTHIRRDGAWLCKKDVGKHKHWYKRDSHIKFNQAHKIDVKVLTNSFLHNKQTYFYYCQECVKRYFEILDNLPDPIVVDN